MAVKPITPVFKRWSTELGAWQWGLQPEDFRRVQMGYACERCLEPFEHHVDVCPVCRLPQRDHTVLEMPSEWRKQGE